MSEYQELRKLYNIREMCMNPEITEKITYAPVKLDHDIIIDSRGREYIKNFKYSLCTVDDIKKTLLRK